MSKACASLRAKRDAEKLSIADLVTLLKWKGAEVPKDRSKDGKPAMVRVWIALAVPDEAIGAEASKAAAAPAADPPAAPAKKQKKRQAAESDDEEEKSDDESDDQEEAGVRMRVRITISMRRARCSTKKGRGNRSFAW